MTTPAIIGLAGPILGADERDLLRRHTPRGIILFARNIVDREQLRALILAIRKVLPDALLMVDQEGGRVARLKPPHWPELPPAGSLKTEEAAFAHGRALGEMTRQAGFNVVTAPVLDLRLAGGSDVIGDRAISADPEIVARLGGRIGEGILASGMIPVMKHLPGHGRAKLDSHVALPEVDATAAELAHDFLPFTANNHLPWGMTAHVRFTALDPKQPATLSEQVIRHVIRDKIGFEGVLVSDDLAMGALRGSPAERARAAVAAGCDLALYCPGDMPGNIAVLEALNDGG